jgi:hypothetical protein
VALNSVAPPDDGMLHRVIALLLVVSGGTVAYLATHAVLWLLAGRPNGPERFLGESARHVLSRRGAGS